MTNRTSPRPGGRSAQRALDNGTGGRPVMVPQKSRRRPIRSLARAASWHRRKLAVVAALGAVLTGIAAAAPEGPPTVEVVRAKRQLVGGAVISLGDVSVERVVAADAPEGAVSDPGALVGQTLAAPIARRQVLTSLAFISTRVGVARGHVLAPLRLADAELATLLHPGDVVDVLAADPQSEKAAVVAQAARVVTVPRLDDEAMADSSGALVLVDVDNATARVLARAAVSGTLTVIWR
jgi:Flp pilus assembly protein CpaB